MKVKSESEVTQLCPTLSDPMDCSLPGSSVHGIFQARVLEWGAIDFSAISSRLFISLACSNLSGSFVSLWCQFSFLILLIRIQLALSGLMCHLKLVFPC